jgi:hypothetical protein
MTRWMTGLSVQAYPDNAGSGSGSATATATNTGADGKPATDSKTGADGKTGTETGAGADGKQTKDGTSTSTETAGADGQQATPKAPEKYELKVPENGATYLDGNDLKAIQDFARENDMTNDEAQAELESVVKRAVEREQVRADAYIAELKANADFGGDRFDETQRLARLAVDKVLPAGNAYRDEFIKLISRPAIGNYLPVVAFLATLGKHLGEDTVTKGASTGGTGKKSAAEVLYGPEP